MLNLWRVRNACRMHDNGLIQPLALLQRKPSAMTRTLIVFLPLFFLICITQAQELKNLDVELRWNPGRVITSDSVTLTGEICHNEVQGSFIFRKNAASDDQRFLEQSDVLAVEYQDLKDRTTRTFYWLAVKNPETGNEIVDFYEVIKVLNDFVVVSRKNKLQAQRGDDMNYAIPVGNRHLPSSTSALTLSQTEEFYFLNANGDPELYLTMEYAYIDATIYKYKRNKGYVSDKNLFSKYMGTHWPGVVKHLKKNRVRLDNRKGIITALNYYTDLIETRY